MSNLLNKKLKNSKTTADFLFSFVDDECLHFFDVGARNGSFLLTENYTNKTCLYAFEPNPKEFEKLKKNNTDAKVSGIIEPTFKKKKIFKIALFNKKIRKKLYITTGPGAVSLMGEVNKKMAINLSLNSHSEKNYFEEHQKLLNVSKVRCDTIDNIWKKGNFIDFLKLDTEGSELFILHGAKKNLEKKKILMIKTEFLNVPYYNKNSLLGKQQIFLDKYGYRLIYLDQNHLPYSWKKSNSKIDFDKKFQYAGDAYFIPDPDLNKLSDQQFLRIGLICLALGFNSSGINFIRESNLIKESIIQEIKRLSLQNSKLRKLSNIWKSVPGKVANFLKLKIFD